MNRKPIPTSGVTYGYVRVSTRDQNEFRQMDAMKQFGVPDRILFPTVWVRYTDKLIWAELRHGKKAGIVTSHGNRKRRTRNEK